MDRHAMSGPPGAPDPSALPPPLDQDKWDEAAQDFAIQTLTRVRTTAEKWTGTIGVLLGAFGASAVFVSPQALGQSLPRPLTVVVYTCLILVSLLAISAISFGALAAQGGIPRAWDNWNGDTYAAYVIGNAGKAAGQLRLSRWLGAAAAALVFVLGCAVLADKLAEPGRQTSYVVVFDNGYVACGTLSKDAQGTAAVGGQALHGVRQITEVSACP
jgi:hypothetical protein